MTLTHRPMLVLGFGLAGIVPADPVATELAGKQVELLKPAV